jgi:ubiquinone/menaquinone biosynthesis C-methylase UbiE
MSAQQSSAHTSLSVELTTDFVNTSSYTDFVGLVNQTNIPPGSYNTVTQWITNGFVKADSHVVEVACTTGFSVRELARTTGCTGEGVDISHLSIERAKQNAQKEIAQKKLNFKVADATKFNPEKKATHVVVGAALGFFPQPEVMINQLTTFFKDDTGVVLASPFYTTSSIPDNLVKLAQSVLGITPTLAPYKDVMKLYKDFQIRFENRQIPTLETHEEIQHYCISTITRTFAQLRHEQPEVFSAMYERLFEIRDLTNQLRRHQGYSVLILGYDKNEFGNRYVELF